jgi:hypothetical protein
MQWQEVFAVFRPRQQSPRLWLERFHTKLNGSSTAFVDLSCAQHLSVSVRVCAHVYMACLYNIYSLFILSCWPFDIISAGAALVEWTCRGPISNNRVPFSDLFQCLGVKLAVICGSLWPACNVHLTGCWSTS